MPLTEKGKEIMENMKKEYGEKEGERVFYASANSGRISGVHDAGAVGAPPTAQPKLMDAPKPPGPEREMTSPEPPGSVISVTNDSLADVNRRNRERYSR